MSSEKFCHLCGDKVAGASTRIRLTRPRCAACKRKTGRGALLPALLFALALAAGFVAGRATSERRSINFIGVPADPLTLQNLPADPQPGDQAKPDPTAKADASVEGVDSKEANQALCGAPTRKGRPCRRRVRGSGHCWQHKK